MSLHNVAPTTLELQTPAPIAAANFSSADSLAALRARFAPVVAHPAPFAARFYELLFQRARAVRALFPDDLSEQQSKLGQTLCLLMASLHDRERLIPALRRLGAAHVGYGAQSAHFAVVGEVLLQTLQGISERPLEPATVAAWNEVYAWVTAQMQAGAQAARAAQA